MNVIKNLQLRSLNVEYYGLLYVVLEEVNPKE